VVILVVVVWVSVCVCVNNCVNEVFIVEQYQMVVTVHLKTVAAAGAKVAMIMRRKIWMGLFEYIWVLVSIYGSYVIILVSALIQVGDLWILSYHFSQCIDTSGESMDLGLFFLM